MKKIKKNMILFSLTLLLAGVIAFGAKADVFAADASLSPVQGVKQITHVTSSVSETTAVRISWDAVPYTTSTEENSNSKNSTGSRALPDDLSNLLPDNGSGNKTLADTVLYKVEYCPQGGTWKTFNEAVPYTYATITGLDAGKSYEVRVSAYVYTKDAGSDNSYTKTDLASESAPVVVVTAPAANDKFSFTQTKASTTSVTITYAAAEGANLYEVGYMSSNMSSYQTVTTNKTTVTFKKISKNTLTDVYVIPCRKSDAGYTAKSSTKVSGEVALVPSKPSVKYVRV
ncbi:MAG: fibronectin type III domain-containing protein, partial [Lachnospiraceae bacterium]|nr:fibronectin type III domain-containing protein [Lachnospiraceae bacterium]